MIWWPTPMGGYKPDPGRCLRCGEPLEWVTTGLTRVRLRCEAGDTIEGLASSARTYLGAKLRYWWAWYFGAARKGRLS